MNKNQENEDFRLGLHYFRRDEITEEDLLKVKEMDGSECPRRYCWWWHSLGFEWELTAEEGCTWAETAQSENWPHKDERCIRCDKSSTVDLFESRGPHIAADGVDPSKWFDYQKEQNHNL